MKPRATQRILPVAAAAALFATSLLSSSDKPVFTSRQKAFYADADLVAFVRPGLVVDIASASIAPDGTIQVQFTIADPRGLPLDRAGVTTPGTVSTSFVAAQIPRDQEYYVAYTTTTQQGEFGPAVQPAADSGGTYTQTGPGQYTYTFRTKAANADPGATNAVGVWATRDLSEFDLGTDVSNDVLEFVPAGGAPPKTHNVIDTATCNKCHDPLEAHGGARQIMPLCVLCHTQPAIDAETGNSIQFRQMIHKIHQGSALPSVQAGTPYRIIGFRGAVNDYSDIVFPASLEGEGARPCQFCHEGTPFQGGTPPGAVTANQQNPPPDNKWWLTRPSIEACGSCHDNVNFVTGENHPAGPAPNSSCANCHIAQSDMLFDASIFGAHVIPRYALGFAPTTFTIEGITNTGAGQRPAVTFTIADENGAPVAPSSMGALNLTLAGPSPSYQSFLVTESARMGAVAEGAGYTYTFNAAIPANATGTYTVGIEGYRNVTVAASTPDQATVRAPGRNQVLDFSVDGGPVSTLVVVENANCNSCHYFISAHGQMRNNPQYCRLCHNAVETDAEVRPADQMPAQSIYLPFLIHRLHAAGGISPQTEPFIVYGFRSSVNNFSEVLYPGDLANCAKCHVNNSQQLPAPAGRVAVVNPRGFINPAGPETIACLACHNSQPAAAHALQMGGDDQGLGEACAVCHGPNSQFSVDREHAR